MENRYAIVGGKFLREIVLLKGQPCSYGKCTFCNYTLDNSTNISENFKFNKKLLDQVTGEYKVLEVINSGNVVDLDNETIEYIQKIVKEKQIKIVYFEMFLNKMHEINSIKNLFVGVEIRMRLGLETFDDEFRQILGKKFIFNNLANKLSENYYSACLMVCIKGQTKTSIINDIELGLKYFKTITVNKWVENTTPIKEDKELTKWFVQDVYPELLKNERVEILIDNKDLGVFEQ